MYESSDEVGIGKYETRFWIKYQEKSTQHNGLL